MKRVNASETVLPMSKHDPMEDMYPSSNQRTKRSIWSVGSNSRHSIKLAARHNAIDVSSVH